MSEIVVDRRHNLGLRGATRLAQTMARHLQRDFGDSYRWEGNTLHFKRPGASGHVAVTEYDVRVRIELDLLLSTLRARVERNVRTFFDEHLGEVSADQRLRPAARRSEATKSSRSQGTSRSVRPK